MNFLQKANKTTIESSVKNSHLENEIFQAIDRNLMSMPIIKKIGIDIMVETQKFEFDRLSPDGAGRTGVETCLEYRFFLNCEKITALARGSEFSKEWGNLYKCQTSQGFVFFSEPLLLRGCCLTENFKILKKYDYSNYSRNDYRNRGEKKPPY